MCKRLCRGDNAEGDRVCGPRLFAGTAAAVLTCRRSKCRRFVLQIRAALRAGILVGVQINPGWNCCGLLLSGPADSEGSAQSPLQDRRCATYLQCTAHTCRRMRSSGAGPYACVHADVPAGQGSESDAESRPGSQGSWNDGAEGDAAGSLCRTRRNPAEPVATRPQPRFVASSGAKDIEHTLHQVECTRRQEALPGGDAALSPQGSADDLIIAVEHSSLSVSDLMEANRTLREKLMELHAVDFGSCAGQETTSLMAQVASSSGPPHDLGQRANATINATRRADARHDTLIRSASVMRALFLLERSI
jgi:hypothetical protein